jgi:VWFA-related protein
MRKNSSNFLHRRRSFYGSAWLLVSAAIFLAGTASFAQQPASNGDGAANKSANAATFSADVKVVNILATVRDKHGKIVSNLNASDFTLQEDGHPASIQYFSRETNLPLTLGLLVDTSLSQRTVLDQEKSASKTFLTHILHDKDAAFVLHFDREVELLQDLTSSREKLDAALENLETPTMRSPSDSPGTSDPDPDDRRGGGRGRGMRRAGTTLYDAVYLASDDLMKKQQGRKALVILSDGVDRGSKESLESAMEAAQRADTVVYTILFKGEEEFREHRGGLGYPGGGGMGGPMGGGGRRRGGGGQGYPQEERPDGKKILERISKETGGRLFEVSKKQPVDQIYNSIEEELRNQYSLGFAPAKTDSLGYHKLVLRANQKDTTVQARDGFYMTQ